MQFYIKQRVDNYGPLEHGTFIYGCPEVTTKHRQSDLPADCAAAVWHCAHGCYQRHILEGSEAWSGATLKGKARKYGAHYDRSRSGLIDSINHALRFDGWSARVPLVKEHGSRYWRRVLVLTHTDGRVHLW